MFRKLGPSIAGATAFTLFGAVLAWGIHALWQMDNEPLRGNSLSSQLMHRKTSAMQDILDGMVRGDPRQVDKAATKMKSIGFHVEWYLSIPLYEKEGGEFRDSVQELDRAMSEKDWVIAREATLRLERSCIECHALINSRGQPFE